MALTAIVEAHQHAERAGAYLLALATIVCPNSEKDAIREFDEAALDIAADFARSLTAAGRSHQALPPDTEADLEPDLEAGLRRFLHERHRLIAGVIEEDVVGQDRLDALYAFARKFRADGLRIEAAFSDVLHRWLEARLGNDAVDALLRPGILRAAFAIAESNTTPSEPLEGSETVLPALLAGERSNLGPEVAAT